MTGKKRYLLKALLAIAIITALPLMIFLLNRMISIFLNRDYKPIDSGPSTGHYVIRKIVTGRFESYYPNTGLVDTIVGYKIGGKNLNSGGDDTTSAGFVYFDTVKYQFKLQVTKYIPSKKNPEMRNPVTHYLTFDRNAKVISDVPDSNTKAIVNLKNCVSLRDVIQPWQKWSDKSKSIYISHFSEDDFDFPTFNLFPVDSSSPHCYWSGSGYYNIKRGNEILKFKAPCRSRAVLWTEDDDLVTGLSLYPLPKAYVDKLDVELLVFPEGWMQQNLYMITRK